MRRAVDARTVAWRGDAWPHASVGMLEQVTGHANSLIPTRTKT